MSRGPQLFKQTDVAKAIKAAMNAGLPIARVEVAPDGRIIVIAGKSAEGQSTETETNEWDSVK